jgi:hypothetical protein
MVPNPFSRLETNFPHKTFIVKSLTLATQVLWVQVIILECTRDLRFLAAFTKLRNRLLAPSLSVCPSVRPSARNNSGHSGRIFTKFWYWSIFLKYVEKIQVSLKSDKNHEYFTSTPIYNFDDLSLSSSYNEKSSCRENQNEHFYFQNFFISKIVTFWVRGRKIL